MHAYIYIVLCCTTRICCLGLFAGVPVHFDLNQNMCAYACMRACVFTRVCSCVYVRMCMYVRVRVLVRACVWNACTFWYHWTRIFQVYMGALQSQTSRVYDLNSISVSWTRCELSCFQRGVLASDMNIFFTYLKNYQSHELHTGSALCGVAQSDSVGLVHRYILQDTL